MAIVVREQGMPERARRLDGGSLTIGRRGSNDIVLRGAGVGAKHAWITVKDDRVTIEERDVRFATHVNGTRIIGSQPVTSTDRIEIGEYTLVIADNDVIPRLPPAVLSAAPAERELIEVIANGDTAGRLVYADWLEGSGALLRAEFLRMQEAIGSTEIPPRAARKQYEQLRKLAPIEDIGWRVQVARAPIERCQFQFECPKEWSNLARTDRDDVRFCGACQQQVFYCATVEEAKHHARQDHCVAVDASNSRRSDDLDDSMMVGRMADEPE